MAAPPPPNRPADDESDYYSYSDYSEESKQPSPARAGPPPGFPTPGGAAGPPPIPQRPPSPARGLPPLPGGGRVSRSSKASRRSTNSKNGNRVSRRSRRSKASGQMPRVSRRSKAKSAVSNGEDEYYYYDEEDGYDYEYEYEYADEYEYEYEYEYEDAPSNNRVSMNRSRVSVNRSRVPSRLPSRSAPPIASRPVQVEQPKWMTTGSQADKGRVSAALGSIDTNAIGERLALAKAKAASRGQPGANGRVSAKLRVSRVADPNNPNKFISKNRVSYKVRKPDGDKTRVSKRVSKRVSRKSANGRAGLPSISRVSARRKRRPNTSMNRTSVNQGIFAAKQKRGPEQPGIGKGDGCYLQFDSANGGALFAQWTTDGIEDGQALAFFKPESAVPRLNYRKNRGRVDLMTGTDGDKIKACEAWAYFFALAKEHNGNFSVLKQGKQEQFQVDFVTLSPQGEVNLVERDEIDTSTLQCIAVLPFGSRAFDGVEKVTSDFFIKNALREGHALKLV